MSVRGKVPMANTAIKQRLQKKLNNLHIFSLFKRRHKNSSKKSTPFSKADSDTLSKDKDAMVYHLQVAAPFDDASDDYHCGSSQSHQHACPYISSKNSSKNVRQVSHNLNSYEENFKQRILDLPLFLLLEYILLLVTSRFSRAWNDFLNLAWSTKEALAVVIFVVADLAFGVFVIILYSRELSIKPLVFVFDELKYFSAYLIAWRPSKELPERISQRSWRSKNSHLKAAYTL